MEDRNPIEITNLLTDRYVAKILLATHGKPLSAQQLSRKYDIPIAMCYRAIKQLGNLGFVICIDKVLNNRGKWVKRYISQVIKVSAVLEHGKFRAKVELASGMYGQSATGWNVIDSNDINSKTEMIEDLSRCYSVPVA